MHRPLAAALVALLAATACATSQLDPDADVRLSVQVTQPDGTPAAGARAVLSRAANPADVVGGIGAGLMTLGIACAVEPEPRLCDEGNVRTTSADAGGRASFDLKGRDTQDFLGFANEFDLTATVGAAADELSGPSTTGRFLIQVEGLDLGPFATWRPTMGAASDGGFGTLEWSAAPPALGTEPAVTFDDGVGGTLWSQRADGSTSLRLDARLLEGTTGGVHVAVRQRVSAPASDLDLTYRSGRRPYRATGSLPVTRGKPCVVDGTDGPVTVTPCHLDDGSFLEPSEPSGPSVSRIDLGEPTELTMLAVRGCIDRCAVYAASDAGGAGAVRIFDATAPFAAHTPSPPVTARYLWVALATDPGSPTPDPAVGGDPDGVTELSAWSGPPDGTLELLDPRALTSADLAAAGGPAALRARGDGGVPAGLIAIGVAALVAVVGAGAFALGRRRT